MQRVGDYQLVEKIGSGGMGEVWRAENVHTHVPCAVKILPAEATADSHFVARFFDEGRVMQTLNHPRIVRVHHVGKDEASGRYFLVEELVEQKDAKGAKSCSLHDLLDQASEHRLPEADVRKWAVQVAEALAYAHANGVIHRDIKPANILIDENGDARVTDFGLAKAVGDEYIQSQIHVSIQQSMGMERTMRGETDGPAVRPYPAQGRARPPGAPSSDLSMGDTPTMDTSGSGGSRRSTAQALLGTYDYMSPEQRGELPGVDASSASDVYAFGVMIYRMLTGRRPTGRAKAVSEVCKDVSPFWDVIVDRCLEHEPDDRFADGGGLLAALEGRMGAAHRDGSPYLSGARVGRDRRARRILVPLALVGVLVGGLIFYRSGGTGNTHLEMGGTEDVAQSDGRAGGSAPPLQDSASSNPADKPQLLVSVSKGPLYVGENFTVKLSAPTKPEGRPTVSGLERNPSVRLLGDHTGTSTAFMKGTLRKKTWTWNMDLVADEPGTFDLGRVTWVSSNAVLRAEAPAIHVNPLTGMGRVFISNRVDEAAAGANGSIGITTTLLVCYSNSPNEVLEAFRDDPPRLELPHINGEVAKASQFSAMLVSSNQPGIFINDLQKATKEPKDPFDIFNRETAFARIGFASPLAVKVIGGRKYAELRIPHRIPVSGDSAIEIPAPVFRGDVPDGNGGMIYIVTKGEPVTVGPSSMEQLIEAAVRGPELPAFHESDIF